MIQLMIAAACGWFLLVPPKGGSDNVRPDLKRPYSEWTQFSAHDNANDCEAKKKTLPGEIQSRAKELDSLDKDRSAQEKLFSEMLAKRLFFASLEARCISSDLLPSFPKK